MTQSGKLKLSICIPTFNRARFIGEALESIIAQASNECEIVVCDNASTDHTQQVVSEYARRFDRLRYIKQDANMGFDRNCDYAVESARGEYCWLFSDDDIMKPGAIATVLEALRQEFSLVLVNGEHRDVTMSNLRIRSFFGVDSDRVYSPGEFDRMFEDVGVCALCVCCVIIKRTLWVERERERYYGSWFIHTAVVFQEPLPGNTLVIAKPIMSLRLGNEQTSNSARFYVWYISWPELLWSFPLDEATKRKFCGPNPWREFRYLLALRAVGRYSRVDYKRWVRPRLRAPREVLIPSLVALLSETAAHCFHILDSFVFGRPRSPYDVIYTMFPKSLRLLCPDRSQTDVEVWIGQE